MIRYDWIAAIFSLTGASLIAYKQWYGYPICLISNLAWIKFGNQIDSKALQLECMIYFMINLFGIYYWRIL